MDLKGTWKDGRDWCVCYERSMSSKDDIIRVLIGSRLKGKALLCFHLKPEHIKLTVDQLLADIETCSSDAQIKFSYERYLKILFGC